MCNEVNISVMLFSNLSDGSIFFNRLDGLTVGRSFRLMVHWSFPLEPPSSSSSFLYSLCSSFLVSLSLLKSYLFPGAESNSVSLMLWEALYKYLFAIHYNGWVAGLVIAGRKVGQPVISCLRQGKPTSLYCFLFEYDCRAWNSNIRWKCYCMRCCQRAVWENSMPNALLHSLPFTGWRIHKWWKCQAWSHGTTSILFSTKAVCITWKPWMF